MSSLTVVGLAARDLAGRLPTVYPHAHRLESRGFNQEASVPADSLVFLVDDDPCLLPAMESLLRNAQLSVRTFASAEDFLACDEHHGPACLVLDVGLPGIDGLELQRELAKRSRSLPIIFVTGTGQVPVAVRAMKAGCFEFLLKPVESEALLEAVRAALARSASMLQEQSERLEMEARLLTLTTRERDVMTLVVTGLLNKQIGAQLGISEVTVKIHRARAMRKMKARSLPELVRMHSQAGAQQTASGIVRLLSDSTERESGVA
jgi:FixJ family two-component response regulator